MNTKSFTTFCYSCRTFITAFADTIHYLTHNSSLVPGMHRPHSGVGCPNIWYCFHRFKIVTSSINTFDGWSFFIHQYICFRCVWSHRRRDAHPSSNSSGIISRRSQSLQCTLSLPRGLRLSCSSTDLLHLPLRELLATLGGNSCRRLCPWSFWPWPRSRTQRWEEKQQSTQLLLCHDNPKQRTIHCTNSSVTVDGLVKCRRWESSP